MSEVATAATPTAVYTPGAFVWHELQTKDVAKAATFYETLLGWTIKPVEMAGGMTYHLVYVGDKQIGGIFDAMADGVPTAWTGYVSVPDVDAAADRAKAAGGQVVAGPADIPNVGRFALAVDPQGAAISLFKSAHHDPDTAAPAYGEFCWDHLNATDANAAAAYYEQVVGWQPANQTLEGGVFKYGELMEASYGVVPSGVPAHWLTNVVVADLDVATQKAETLGAKVLMAKIDAGEWGHFTVIQDPVGAAIALFQGHQA